MKFKVTLVICVMLTSAGVGIANSEETDARQTLKVRLALLDHLGVNALDIETVATGGDVLLKGSVRDRDVADLAWTIARSVSGVDGVRNRVEVVADPPGSSTDSSRREAEVTNTVLSGKVLLAIIDSLGSDGVGIGATSSSGTVTLKFGANVPPNRRKDAEEVAKGVPGVTGVKSVSVRN